MKSVLQVRFPGQDTNASKLNNVRKSKTIQSFPSRKIQD